MSLPDRQEPTRLPCGHGQLDLTGPGCFVCEYERVQRERQEARERVASLERESVAADLGMEIGAKLRQEAEARVISLEAALAEFAHRVERDRREPDKLLTYAFQMRSAAGLPMDGENE